MIFNLLVYYIVPHVCKDAFLNQQTYMYIVILYKNSQKNAQIVTDLQSSCNKVVVKRADEHVKTYKLLQVCKRVIVTNLFTSC